MERRKGERAVMAVAPVAPPRHGRQGLGFAASQRRIRVFKLSPDCREDGPRPETPSGWGLLLGRGCSSPVILRSPQVEPLEQGPCRTSVVLSV